jgi:putative MFS transporter
MAAVVKQKADDPRHSAAARLDRLPIGAFQKQIMWTVAYVYFFELGDLNNFGLVAPQLREQWKMSIATVGVITSAAFLGMFVGALAGGWLSDKFGRKKMLIVATVCYSFFSLLTAFAWNVPGLLVTRFLTGMGLSALTVVANTYISEMFPTTKRGSYQAWVMVIGLIGIPAAALVAAGIIPLATYGWRFVFGFGALGIFMGLFYRKLEESPRWYEDQGRLKEADAALDRIEARCKPKSGRLPVIGADPASKPTKSKLSDLFAGQYRSRTLMFIGVYVFQTLGLFGFMAWVPTLLAARGLAVDKSALYVVIMYTGAPIGALLAAFISDKWERKYMIAIAAVVIAGLGVAYGLSTAMLPIIMLGFGVAMFIQTFAAMLFAYTPECFPSAIRSSGSGLTYGAGRLANSGGPMLLAYLYGSFGYKLVFVYIATMWVLVSVIMMVFGPKTRGRALT